MGGGGYYGLPTRPSHGIRIAVGTALVLIAFCALMYTIGLVTYTKLNTDYEYAYQVGQEVQVKHTSYTGVIVARVGGTYHIRINQNLALVYDIHEFELEAK